MYFAIAAGSLLVGIPNAVGAVVAFAGRSSDSAPFELVYGVFFIGVGAFTLLTFRAFHRGLPARDRFRTGLFGMVLYVLGGIAFTVWGLIHGRFLAVFVGIAVAGSFGVLAVIGWVRLRRADVPT
jgi:hypothetical protein